ncbi:hypothetical protein ACG02S_00980 [Roseateles sp. DC23W]|uniref:Uncharacterized protein n=1 Tax=Pelomonas dachongensis TaxID=3299029 RepID=A0ABW7EHS8_9BURK
MGATEPRIAEAEALDAAWGVLDEGLQVLVRAESLMMLIQCAMDVEEHHRYGAGMAWDLLRELKENISDAQAHIRGRHPRRGRRKTALVEMPAI